MEIIWKNNHHGHGAKKENKDAALVDFTKELWATKVPKKTWKLSMSDLKEEITWRVGSEEPPQFKHWSVPRCTGWLISNLITQLGDVKYICHTVQEFVVPAKEAAVEAQEFAPAARACYAAPWQGNVPYIQLLLCLVEDDLIQNAYLHHLDALSCTQLDAHNSIDQRGLDVHEMLADKWNDPNFNPILPTNDVHKDYCFPTDCSHETVWAKTDLTTCSHSNNGETKIAKDEDWIVTINYQLGEKWARGWCPDCQ
jgi:hypothetical protein